jgi:glyoxylase-like metal-dependent hydrolase (beta-lactamase superfamily II)
MQRRIFIKNAALSLSVFALLNQSSLAQFLTDPAWKIKMLTEDIGIFIEKGGTILFMITKKGVVVVDAQFPDSVQHLMDEIKKKTVQPYHLLINTHHHFDHTAGNIVFKGLVPKILAHANSKINQAAAAIKQKTENNQLYPNQTYTDSWNEKIGNEKIRLHYFGPGHTNGDSLVHLQNSNIVHMGDLVFNRRHPYIDKTAGADIANWIVLLDKATQTFDSKTIYISGHAGTDYDTILSKDDVLMFRDYLGNVMKFTEAEMKAGRSKEDILKTVEIPGSPQWKGEGIQRPLTAALEELSQK